MYVDKNGDASKGYVDGSDKPLTDRDIHASVLNHLFHIMYQWDREAKYAETKAHDEGIRCQAYVEMENLHKSDYNMSYSTPSSESAKKMDSYLNDSQNARNEMKHWMTIIRYTAEKFGLELYKTEKNEDGWRTKKVETTPTATNIG